MLAAACEDAGAAADDPSAAVALLKEALAGFESLDATRDERRVAALLRSRGVRSGQRGSRGRPATGWAALTPTECRVVELLCSGLTNRQVGERLFTSTRTVDTHVTHVFRKLGISSRVELVTMAAAARPRETGDREDR
ncbi:MAG: helix-turn-helix domain-containing protein [Acidimicrobiales bacterium]